MDKLFSDRDGTEYGISDITDILKEIGADDCETLFIHSDITFGKPLGTFDRKDYLSGLYESLLKLNVRNIITPTFTYSFCNHEEYDVMKSRSSMGALSEFIRKSEGRYRTLDPLLSLSVPEDLRDRFSGLSNHSLGEGSGLDRLHQMDGVKFLFFGAKQSECFTYVHYVEKMLDVPYRYDQPFTGTVIDAEGNHTEKTQYIHTHCKGVIIPQTYTHFENYLIDKGMVKKKRLGDQFVSCLGEKDAYTQIADRIRNDPFYFVEGRYTESDLVHEYGYSTDNGRITHC